MVVPHYDGWHYVDGWVRSGYPSKSKFVPMKRPEQSLQIAVASLLDVALPKDASWFHIPNSAKRGVVEGAMMKAMGTKAGMPDICIVWRGRAIFIELKAGKTPVTEKQKDKMLELTLCGALCTVCRSFDEVMDFINTVFGSNIR